jgi:hypothetical protein
MEPLVSRMKIICFGSGGTSSGAKKWTKYPSMSCKIQLLIDVRNGFQFSCGGTSPGAKKG